MVEIGKPANPLGSFAEFLPRFDLPSFLRLESPWRDKTNPNDSYPNHLPSQLSESPFKGTLVFERAMDGKLQDEHVLFVPLKPVEPSSENEAKMSRIVKINYYPKPNKQGSWDCLELSGIGNDSSAYGIQLLGTSFSSLRSTDGDKTSNITSLLEGCTFVGKRKIDKAPHAMFEKSGVYFGISCTGCHVLRDGIRAPVTNRESLVFPA